MKYFLKNACIAVLMAFMLPFTAKGQHAEQMLGLENQQQSGNVKNWAQNVLAISFNPGFITSKVDTGYGEKSWVGGTGFTADYRCVFRSGYGFGLAYSHSQTNYDTGWNGSTSVKLDYFGPSFVMASPIGEHWSARLSWGIGYALYSDGYDSQGGFGYQFMGGVEYRLGRVMALGVDLTETVHTFSRNESTPKDKVNGFSRLGLNMGLRLYM